jgi:ER protein Pkr1
MDLKSSENALKEASHDNDIPATLLDSILSSILTPGASAGLISSINAILLLLIATLVTFSLMGVTPSGKYFDIHMILLMVFALGLLVSLNYFIYLSKKTE